ncbi:MAG TPA: recombinase family protein [Methylomusa anaerophila]|jgi:DNA invertase Pin-like site-specific DNA recombinase|uniref:Transposon Tn3 resolvase n=1 Tax=Methylomusa anaerophila TaxID=1930071 RepID=A0A348AN09_9FIRM|nr:recombinase family protein [Methylomusa anaerophila]BBB92457.1 transposon Tn3 resolvase [Methylomusa anaerophila]HML87691.1 recombinase family protein [Methylomusa anaerophila]
MQTAAAKKKNISIIPPQPEYDRSIKVQFKALRVAAYCRVSTLLEQQEGSYEAQISYYTEKIKSNPNWKMAGIYADDGKSATNTKKRDDFNAMIEDCLAGKIDMVITKSVSRFARNTVDCLQNIRKLKEKNVAIFFEKEGVNTLEGSGELLITILSSQAQEESRNLSENTRWGLVRRFENGIMSINHNKFMGYTKDENGDLVIVPEEAEIVRRIFRLFLEGSSYVQIAKILESEGILTVTGKKEWCPSVIDQMLENEKYMGDALLQKTYTVDFLTKKRVKNQGIVQQYYIQDNHEAIIPKELFYRVQEEKARRASLCKSAATRRAKKEQSKYSSKYSLSDIMICKECGQPYRRQVWSKNGQKSAVWRCENRLKNGTKHCKHSPTLKEDVLNEAIMTAINNVVENRGDFVGAFRENVIQVIGSYSTKNVPTEYDEQITKLQGEMLTLIEENAKMGSITEDFDEQYHKIAEQIKELKQKKLDSIRDQKRAADFQQRVSDMDTCLKKVSCSVRDFDDDLVRRLLQGVKVINEDTLEIQFKSGIVMKQRIPYCN